MLALTRKTEYALIALCHLARERGRTISAREIATRYSVSLPLLMNVLKALHLKQVVRSVRGARGGYVLESDPRELTLSRLIACIEGPVRLVRCAGGPAPGGRAACDLLSCCPVRQPLLRVHEYLERTLAALTIAQIAFDSQYGVVASGPALKVMNS